MTKNEEVWGNLHLFFSKNNNKLLFSLHFHRVKYKLFHQKICRKFGEIAQKFAKNDPFWK